MRHLDIEKEAEHLVGHPLSDEDKKELKKRLHYAQVWIDTYAPENYQFAIQEKKPDVVLSDIQKKALSMVLEYLKSVDVIDGQAMHSKLHEIKEATQINPKEFFEAIYLSVLNKKSGPKAGWFLSVIDREFLVRRFGEVV